MTVCALCIPRTFTSNPKRTRSNFLQWMKSNALKPLIVFNVFLSLSFSPTPVSFSSLFFCTLLFYVAFTSLFSFVCKLKFFNENGEIIFQQKPAPALIFPCCGKSWLWLLLLLLLPFSLCSIANALHSMALCGWCKCLLVFIEFAFFIFCNLKASFDSAWKWNGTPPARRQWNT